MSSKYLWSLSRVGVISNHINKQTEYMRTQDEGVQGQQNNYPEEPADSSPVLPILKRTVHKQGKLVSFKDALISKEPFYLPIKDEIEIVEAAKQRKVPLAFIGPTGVGKTRFAEYMAYNFKLPIFTVPCNEDITANDILGNFRIFLDKQEWYPGPAMSAAQVGGILYMDEVNKARKDLYSVIFPLSDYRRILPIPKLGKQLEAADEFMLIIACNPMYFGALDELEPSLRQRFAPIHFDFPSDHALEKRIITGETGLDDDEELQYLVEIGEATRNCKKQGTVREGASPRVLVNAAKLLLGGVSRKSAYETILLSVTYDANILESLRNQVEKLVAKEKLNSKLS